LPSSLPVIEPDGVRGLPSRVPEDNLEADLEGCSIRADKRIAFLTAVQLFTNWTRVGIWKEHTGGFLTALGRAGRSRRLEWRAYKVDVIAALISCCSRSAGRLSAVYEAGAVPV